MTPQGATRGSREPPPAVNMRSDVGRADARKVHRLIAATGMFSRTEQALAAELVEERLGRGAASGYEFVFAEASSGMVGYACYGRIPCTVSSFDLYWIAVHPQEQGCGLGQALLQEVEAAVRRARGTRIYVDTSSRRQYAPTRAFYERCGYREVASLADFYAPGDGKVIYCKRLAKARRARG